MEQEPVSLRQLNAGVPLDLETIALKCLQKDPAKRYATAADVAADLQRFLSGEPITARPVSKPERAWRWCRRNPALAMTTTAIAVLLITLKGHGAPVSSVAFSADGKRLASASVGGEVKIWDATSAQELVTLKGHSTRVDSVTFSVDGNRLASASWDQTVKVWDARPWTPELRAEREALSLIRFLSDQGQSQSEWPSAIAADQTISEPVRQRALQFAREWKSRRCLRSRAFKRRRRV